MDWFYSKNGKQEGPVDESTLNEKIDNGDIAKTDLIWKEGMPDWIPATQLKIETSLAEAEPEALFQPQPEAAHPAASKATTPLVLGIVSIVGLCVPYVGVLLSLITGIIAIVQGKKLKGILPQSNPARSKAHLGWVLGLIGVILCVLFIILCIIATAMIMSNPELLEQFREFAESNGASLPDPPSPTE